MLLVDACFLFAKLFAASVQLSSTIDPTPCCDASCEPVSKIKARPTSAFSQLSNRPKGGYACFSSHSALLNVH